MLKVVYWQEVEDKDKTKGNSKSESAKECEIDGQILCIILRRK